MAARENQGYLIAVIVLVLLCLVLALLTFLGMSKASEYSDAKMAAEKNAAFEKARGDSYKAQSQAMGAWLGLDGTTVDQVDTLISAMDRYKSSVDSGQQAAIEEIRKSTIAIRDVYDQDMKVNASASADDAIDMTWKGTIDNLAAVVRKKHNDLYVKDNESRRIQADADAQTTATKNAMAELQKNLTATQEALDKQKRDAALAEEQLSNKLEDNQNNLEQVMADAENFRTTASAEKSKLELAMKGVLDENNKLKAKVNNYEREVFDLPDGKIVKVAARNNTAFLDLGFADGLRVNRTFAVYSQTANNFEKDKHKAMIEVTRIFGDHSAEARVTMEDPTNPILTGDYVLTATWDPGNSTFIALAGEFDLDNDGFSDRDKLVQMIERNGGTVVASHDDDGNITGAIDASTRYLVMGSSPREGIDYNGNVVLAMQSLEDQAKGSTVQIIDTRKLLNWMGVHGKGKVERLDNRIGEDRRRSPSDN
jgi:hypothetical protein